MMRINEAEIDSELAVFTGAIIARITAAMKKAGLKKTDLAERMGAKRSFVTRIFRGHNVTLKTLARVGLAIGIHWEFKQFARPLPFEGEAAVLCLAS